MLFKRFNELQEISKKYNIDYLTIYSILREVNSDEEANSKFEELKGKEFDKELNNKIEKIIKSANSFFDFSIAKEVIVDFPTLIIDGDKQYWFIGLAQDRYDLYFIGYQKSKDKIILWTCVGGYGNYHDLELSEEDKEKANKALDKYFTNNKYDKIIYNSLTGKVF